MKLASEKRQKMISLLVRYIRTSLSAGRIPSLLGYGFHRTSVRSRPHYAIEESVVFVCDVEKCLEDLPPFERSLIAYCILENRSEWEAARHFQRTQPEISRRLGRLLDRLYATFCRKGLLAPLQDEPEPAANRTGRALRGERKHDAEKNQEQETAEARH
jgi:hypothetical protein